MSELCGFVYNKGHQKSRETTREIWRSEGELSFVQQISGFHSLTLPYFLRK